MKSPHEPDGRHSDDIPSEVAEAFHAAPRRLEPPDGTYEALRRRAAGRRRRRGVAVAAALACCTAAGVFGALAPGPGGEAVRTRDVAGAPHAPSPAATPRGERSARPSLGRPTHPALPASPSTSGPRGSSPDPSGTPAAPPPPHGKSPAVSACASAGLKLTAGRGDGAAGSVELPLVFTNTGAQACTLRGFPGVSLVGADGEQLGAAAVRTGSPGASVLLAPGRSARAEVRVTRAQNYPPERCRPADATGLRVYPPDRTQALFVPLQGFSGCTDPGVQLLSVKSVRPAT